MSAYNDADRVACAVESILAQTFRDWEFVVVDDGSTDRTGEILDDLAVAEPRLRVVHQQNTGLTRALIFGCEQAHGENIARQDSDDWSHPERLAEQVKLLESDPGIGFVSCWTEYVGPEDQPLEVVRRPEDSREATSRLLNHRLGPPAHGSVMFRKSIYKQVGGYRLEFHFAQDSDLWLRMAEHAKIAYAQQVLYRFVRSPSSISGRLSQIQHQFGELGQQCRKARASGSSEEGFLLQAAELSHRLRTSETSTDGNSASGGVAMMYLIGSQLVQNGDARARAYLWPVLRRKPWHWRAWVRLTQSVVSGQKRRVEK